jgi:hypothetical protein
MWGWLTLPLGLGERVSPEKQAESRKKTEYTHIASRGAPCANAKEREAKMGSNERAHCASYTRVSLRFGQGYRAVYRHGPGMWLEL